MPKIVGFVAGQDRAEESSSLSGWLMASASLALAGAMAWVSARLSRGKLFANSLSEFPPDTVEKIENAVRLARAEGDQKVLDKEQASIFERIPAGLYSLDLDRGKLRRYKATTSLRGAIASTRLAATRSGYPHALVDTRPDDNSPFPEDPVVIRSYDKFGRTEFYVEGRPPESPRRRRTQESLPFLIDDKEALIAMALRRGLSLETAESLMERYRRQLESEKAAKTAGEVTATSKKAGPQETTKTSRSRNAPAASTKKSSKKIEPNRRKDDGDPSLYMEFQRMINMSASEIDRWRKDPRSKDASFPHIRAELPLLAAMKRTPRSKWTPRMWNKARRAISFVKRHEAQMRAQGKRFGTGRKHVTYKRIVGLLNWGRKTPGVNIKKVLEGRRPKTSRRTRRNGAYWGNRGAGILAIAKNTGRVLLLLRGEDVMEPGTWGIPGGACEFGEHDMRRCAVREFEEETCYGGRMTVFSKPVHVYRDGSFRFENFVAIVDHEFEPDFICSEEDESVDYGWFDISALPSPLHFGVDEMMSESGEKIARIIESVRSGQAIQE